MAGQSAAVKRLGAVMFLCGLLATLPLAGCSTPDDGIPAGEKKNAVRLDEIAKSSGGDFDKLAPADRDYVVKEIAHGDENAARMMIAAKGGRLRGNPGAPPTAGKAPAPPAGQ